MTTTHSFDADVSQLIHLVTHSIYSTKEVFLRELLANANDAIQKAKLLAAQNPAYLGDETDLTISIAVDTDKKIITITDTGVGMTEEEVISNLGTIAKSGTKAFLEQMKQAKEDNALVGQFGIGFYSSFMVAQTVTVETKSA
jgi:molecular chaperone HtpG